MTHRTNDQTRARELQAASGMPYTRCLEVVREHPDEDVTELARRAPRVPDVVEIRTMAMNEARFLGHVEARTSAKRKAIAPLVDAGMLVRAGRSKRGDWYRLGPNATPPAVVWGDGTASGPRVRFRNVGALGASWADDLFHTVAGEDRGDGDEGVIAFEHPNPKLAADGWVYVQVPSRTKLGSFVYVGATPAFFERVETTPAEVAHGFQPDAYLQVVSMSADSAKAFAGREDEPVDLGPADASRFKPGARVWGFKSAASSEVFRG